MGGAGYWTLRLTHPKYIRAKLGNWGWVGVGGRMKEGTTVYRFIQITYGMRGPACVCIIINMVWSIVLILCMLSTVVFTILTQIQRMVVEDSLLHRTTIDHIKWD